MNKSQVFQQDLGISLNLEGMSGEELLKLKFRLEQVMRLRGMRATVGSLGELAIVELFKRRPDLPILSLALPGTKNVDALSRDGQRYSIKTLQHARKTGAIYPDADDAERQIFEFLVLAVVGADMALERVVVFDWTAFCQVRSWDSRMKAWYVQRSERAFRLGRQIALA